MNYIILNNTSSVNISGLLIQELPSISKPKMRTMVEEIDGRDGDIVTKLGYGAYDKTLKIGLRGNYDINSVIAFFNSDGTVVFSNEPDKYYNYQIIEQIDFQRLVRYRTADVLMHCQPFKYEYEETPIESTASTITVINKGNTEAKPIITIYGSGTVTVGLNGSEVFSIVFGDNEYITLDMADMNAYMGGVLLNRNVTGDYNSFALNTGENTITIDGTVTSVTIEQYSRWL